MEEWKDIPGYEGIYEASTLGRIRTAEGKTTINSKQKRVWKQRIMKIHYTKRPNKRNICNEMVSLWKDGKRKECLVARLVAQTWCNGYADNLTVNHKDGDPSNNKPENLEWVSLSDNIIHAYRTRLNKNAVPCWLINKAGEAKEFYSIQEASRYLGRNPKYLSVAVKHKTCIYSADGETYDFVRGHEEPSRQA